MSRHLFTLVLILLSAFYAVAQHDTIKPVDLKYVEVKSYRFNEITARLADVHDTYIIGGRKSQVLSFRNCLHLAEKTGRQIC